MEKVRFHEEYIECPECRTEQWAKVLETWPFYSFIHDCENCGHTIMESEWIRGQLGTSWAAYFEA